MILQVQDKQRKYETEPFISLLEKAIEVTLSGERIMPFLEKNELETVFSLVFVSKNAIKKLNHGFRSLDSVTDVLSFPQIESDKIITKISSDDIFIDESGKKKVVMGDIVICPERADEQAKQIGHSLEQEIVFLTIHSVLHLLGYDHIHQKDENIMIKRQKIIMNILMNREEV